MPDRIPRVQFPTGGGSAAWTADGGVFYTRYPNPGEKPGADVHFYQQVFYHQIGTDPKQDRYSIGSEFPRIAEVVLTSSLDGRFILAGVANGDGGEFAHYVLDTRLGHDEWRQITRFADKVKAAQFGREDGLYLLSVQDAPHGKVLYLPLQDKAKGLPDAKTVVPETQEAVIESMTLTADHLFVTDLVGGPSRLRRFDLQGGESTEVPLPPISAVGEVVALEDNAKGVLLSQTQLHDATGLAQLRSGRLCQDAAGGRAVVEKCTGLADRGESAQANGAVEHVAGGLQRHRGRA